MRIIQLRHPHPDYTGPATIKGRTLHFEDGIATPDQGVNLAGFLHAGYELLASEPAPAQGPSDDPWAGFDPVVPAETGGSDEPDE